MNLLNNVFLAAAIRTNQLVPTLWIMLKGMAGIFIVTGIIILCMVILNAAMANKGNKQ